MTDNEIIEMVKKSAGYVDFSIQGGKVEIIKEISDLINRQKLALEHQRRIIKDLKNTVKNLKTVEYPYIVNCGDNAEIHTKSLADYDNLIADIKREAVEDYQYELDLLKQEKKVIEENAIKDFAERLKGDWYVNGYESPDVDFDDYIDDFVKEMTEVKDNA